jgi:hypothetical protein
MPSTGVVTAAGQPLGFHVPNPFGWGAGTVIGWIVSGITKAINAFFGGLVTDALDPLLKLLGQTLLTTPNPTSLPRVGALWENSREIAVASYALLILAAGILVMAYETVQTRHSIKEIAPRVVVGFLTANMSLLLAGKAVSFANALSTGVLSGGVDPKSAAATLTTLVMGAVTNGGIFLVFLGLGLAGILLALLVTYVIRVALTVILIAGAPLALMCHALPQTEGIARWWWRAFAGVLAIQLAQSLTLVAALNVFLAKGGFTFFGPTKSGLVDLIVTIALLYILYKIPFWILHAIQIGHGRSFLGSAVKGVIAYKTLGLIGLGRGVGGTGRGGPTAGGHPGGPGPGGGGGGRGGAGPGGGGPRGPVRPGGTRRPVNPVGRANAGSSAGRGGRAGTGQRQRASITDVSQRARPLGPAGAGGPGSSASHSADARPAPRWAARPATPVAVPPLDLRRRPRRAARTAPAVASVPPPDRGPAAAHRPAVRTPPTPTTVPAARPPGSLARPGRAAVTTAAGQYAERTAPVTPRS